MQKVENNIEENPEAIALSQAIEIQEQINQYLKQLSLERLQVVADFAAYLADKESEEATQELEKIPGLLERLKKNREVTPKTHLVNWRTIRSDV
ncbi:hypothetical protein F7734_46665 [Scytonema sp. UIC 10036]|uniref:hypothetical protein n=1 Tax=Scytonema sp. UIC 10036 TaxID=2304196 RepID=UPI0012DA58C6|nr:hypothetical protein [Scytonema sp. UIC 10036]MUG99378.1 hypothetical protein [Scytonema sp. UIC 10036]